MGEEAGKVLTVAAPLAASGSAYFLDVLYAPVLLFFGELLQGGIHDLRDLLGGLLLFGLRLHVSCKFKA